MFAIKAALVPLHLWLPGTYGAASPPVAALFAIMTKVGVYAMLRVYVLIFGGNAGAAAWIAEPFVLPAAAVTLAVGMIGVLASRHAHLARGPTPDRLGRHAAPGRGHLHRKRRVGGALLSGAQHAGRCGTVPAGRLVARRRGGAGDRLVAAPRFGQLDLLAGLFFLAAIATVGLPPLSGFVGKLLVLET